MKKENEDILNGNKKVTEADKKFVEKYIEPKMIPTRTLVRNPLSEFATETSPLIETLVRFVQHLAYTDFRSDMLQYWGVPKGSMISLFDRARLLVLKLDKEIYMNVID